MSFLKKTGLTLLLLASFIFSIVVVELILQLKGDLTQLRSQAQTDTICIWDEYWYPHPYYGIGTKDKPECKLKVNNLGTHGDDLPWKKDKDFIILFMGGSVAQQLTSTFPPKKINWVEKHLNRRFLAPNGGQIKVINGAGPNRKQPTQLIQLMEFESRIDAFASLEGFDEIRNINNGLDMWTPSEPFFRHNRFIDIDRTFYSTFRSATELVRRNKILSQSFLVNKLLILLGKAVEDRISLDSSRSHLMKDKHTTQENLKEYEENFRILDAVSLAHGKKGIIFIQPVPGLYRGQAHPQEKSQAEPGKQLFAKFYEETTQGVLKIPVKNIKVKSLLRLYENSPEWIYFDDIHSVVDMRTGYSIGYDRLGKRIAEDLGEYLKLRRKEK